MQLANITSPELSPGMIASVHTDTESTVRPPEQCSCCTRRFFVVPGNKCDGGSEIVLHGETGFLANSEDDWTAALERLLEETTLRTRIGAAGRATVEARYSAAVQAPRVAAIFRGAAA